mmetsp:Transcript_28439/g.60600  ORF Transcript_28439/g.60600 Transcript_28439/m.60600 type:complete len:321 (+) Transcript_28439:256-1218(+)|eukprot:CAMPEP_0172303818 /NCGR_PEP_ID=MMETSP1058-20130122/5337_1 /TAXON_ID=83371 /ORGANISM="Detonula confervacea, Strain CCMP 353" /LENGTH=320 /DNA_ID=CAMNT_0013014819 /DNA_START=224 /DNA_END=1186 /DNA_ORIENTATION=+
MEGCQCDNRINKFQWLLLLAGAVVFFTSHSGNTTLTSWADCARAPNNNDNGLKEATDVHKSTSAIALDSMMFLHQFGEVFREEPRIWELTLLNNSSATVCACAKCGTTSFYQSIYEMTHGREWNFSDPPWVQTLNSKRWTDIEVKQKDQLDGPGHSIALIRDPKERILSAWKDKVMCFERGGANFIPGLLNLAGMTPDYANRSVSNNKPCLGLSEYLQVLYLVHTQNKQGLLNSHFRPQHLYCFLHSPPPKWTVVTRANSPNTICQLKGILQVDEANEDCTMKQVHKSKPLSMYHDLTEMDEALLYAITHDEYQVLGTYL